MHAYKLHGWLLQEVIVQTVQIILKFNKVHKTIGRSILCSISF